MFDMVDFTRHLLLCLHPVGFFFMSVKEIIDLKNGYFEIYDWLGNFSGIAYYLLLAQLIKRTAVRKTYSPVVFGTPVKKPAIQLTLFSKQTPARSTLFERAAAAAYK